MSKPGNSREVMILKRILFTLESVQAPIPITTSRSLTSIRTAPQELNDANDFLHAEIGDQLGVDGAGWLPIPRPITRSTAFVSPRGETQHAA